MVRRHQARRSAVSQAKGNSRDDPNARRFNDESRPDDSDIGNRHSRGGRKVPDDIEPNVARQTKSEGPSLLQTMPLDILYEIFMHLGPRDLVLLTRTSKSLRETLISDDSVTVWKAVRRKAHMPSCPPDFSEPQWATLLFGGKKCQFCGAPNVLAVDWSIRRRICMSCRIQKLMDYSKITKAFPALSKEIIGLAPYTQISESNTKFYLPADIHRIGKQLQTLKNQVKKEAPGAQERLEDYRLKCIESTRRVTQHALICSNWQMDQLNEEAIEALERRRQAIFDKFMKLGYKYVDIYSIRSEDSVENPAPLSEFIWNRIRPSLEKKIQAAQTQRIMMESHQLKQKQLVKEQDELQKLLQHRIEVRTKVVEGVYKSYLKTLVPSQILYSPIVEIISKFPAFKQVIRAHPDIDVSADSFGNAMALLPELSSAWAEQRKTILRKRLARSKTSSYTTPNEEMASPSTEIEVLDLATSVFKCSRSKCGSNFQWGDILNILFGCDAIVTHRCDAGALISYVDGPAPTAVAPSKKGSATAAALVQLAGLDPRRATVTDMDERDALFFCSKCAHTNRGCGHVVYPWRSAVAHAMSDHDDSNARQNIGDPVQPPWQILTQDEETSLTRPADPTLTNTCWSCNHCPAHVEAWTTWENVVEHLEIMSTLCILRIRFPC
ncbi:hypothetical protein FPV67DRAFT_515626 [Lyophyllum atratum]|nr:hypothetical protein FPV67DRAFT_515626 [Lyophyllum atratum]